MSKLLLAKDLNGILVDIMYCAQMALYFDIHDYNADDVISDAASAADDIAVYLGELREVLKEVLNV